ATTPTTSRHGQANRPRSTRNDPGWVAMFDDMSAIRRGGLAVHRGSATLGVITDRIGQSDKEVGGYRLFSPGPSDALFDAVREIGYENRRFVRLDLFEAGRDYAERGHVLVAVDE